MTSVEITAAALPDGGTAVLFTATGLARVTGLTGRVLTEADDPYTFSLRIGGSLIGTVVVGGQPAGFVLQGGASLADVFVFPGSEITVDSTGDPGDGEIEWFATYEPLVPGATIASA